ncbi:F-box associated domain type 1 [Arabidopsis thaliana x Arabidopsis arenosa]|uniref:F-box associated domain type 1 n=1 Tax=Arabidopsis thaliana x Arabidopsis arenosa TaxID=1240361 RepID=A0A8T2A8M6_9BRAS|nr:F-box associated domain type 1 [Arabidopsis thaliana x Arabidopsis arenosa]
MEKMSDLPRELVEEILSRVPVKSMREVRLTCKKWNTLSKHIGKAAAASREGEFLGIRLVYNRVFQISVNLHGIHNNADSFIKPKGKLISLKDPDDVVISEISHCEGLLLCTTGDLTRLVVWNPYTGQTRWICLKDRFSLHFYDHAIGYGKSKSCRAHKILRFDPYFKESVYEIYEFNFNSWRVLDVTPDWYRAYGFGCVSLKGNIYWGATDDELRKGVADFLLCFDFTTERFGPHLSLPFRPYDGDDVLTLSAFGEEQLAVLFQPFRSNGMEIWVTTKIEPNAVLWSKFLAFDLRPLNDGSFLIDKEQRAAVVFHKDRDVINLTRYTAYIIGENGYFREVNIGKITDSGISLLTCSYVPSSVFF